MSEPEH